MLRGNANPGGRNRPVFWAALMSDPVWMEALSYGLLVLVSDIPANQEVGLAEERYFTCGDVNDLKEKIQYHLDNPTDMAEKSKYRTWIQQKYKWEIIAELTVKVCENALPPTAKGVM